MEAGHVPNARAISILCSLGLFLSGCLFYTSSLIQPYYAAEFHLGGWHLGVAQASVPLGAIIGAIQAGWLADKFGRHRLLRMSFLALIVSGLLGGFAYDFNSLCATRVLNGYLAGTLYPLCAAYLIEMSSPSLVSKQTATLMFINCLAAPVACLYAYTLSQFVGKQVLWHLVASMHVIPALIAYTWSRQFPESNSWLFFMETEHPGQTRTCFRTKLSILFGDKYRNTTMCLLGTWFLMDVAYYGVNFFIPYLLSAMNDSNATGTMTPTLAINLFFGIGAFLSIYAIQKIDVYKLQKYGFLLATFSLFALGIYSSQHIHQLFLLTALFIVFNFSINAGPNVTTYLLPATSYPVEVRASGHGISAGVAKFGSFLGVLLLPALQTSLGFDVILIALAGLMFIAYLLTVFLVKSNAYINLDDQSDVAYEKY